MPRSGELRHLAGTNAAAVLLWTSVALARWPRVSAASSREIQQTLNGLRQQAQLAAQRQEADGLLLELAAEGEALSDEFLANAQQEAALRQEILDAQAAYEAALSAEEIVGTIAFVPREEKADDAEFRKMFGSQFEEVLGENPLLDSYELTLTAASADTVLLEGFLAAAEHLPGVEHVSYPARMAQRLHATVGKIRLVLLLFGGALLVISLILLSNTIRLAIFSKRYLINTMKLVGATKWFIMRPFLASSITQGILAGLGAALLFVLAVWGLNETIPELTTVAEAGKVGIILGTMVAGGILISLLFTFFAVNKFVNMKTNKIYLY